MEQHIQPESQELDNDDLQNVVGGLSKNAQTGIVAGAVSVGLSVGGGLLLRHIINDKTPSTGGGTHTSEIPHPIIPRV